MTKTMTKRTFAWDEIDPVANAILALIDAQEALQNSHNAYATGAETEEEDIALSTAVDAAMDARRAAVARLMAAEF